jgi:cob(I)alamin adenosyltransferase
MQIIRYNDYNESMTFYTARGDDETTGLPGEGRLPQYHVCMEAPGILDRSSSLCFVLELLENQNARRPTPFAKGK